MAKYDIMPVDVGLLSGFLYRHSFAMLETHRDFLDFSNFAKDGSEGLNVTLFAAG